MIYYRVCEVDDMGSPTSKLARRNRMIDAELLAKSLAESGTRTTVVKVQTTQLGIYGNGA